MSDSVSLLAPLSPEIVIDDVEGVDGTDKSSKAVLDFTTSLFVDFARFILVQSRTIEDTELLSLVVHQGVTLSAKNDLLNTLSSKEALARTSGIDNPDVLYALSLICSSEKISTNLRDSITSHLLLVLLDLSDCMLPPGLNRTAFFSAILQNVTQSVVDPPLFAAYMNRQLEFIISKLQSNYSHELSQMACVCLNSITSPEGVNLALVKELFEIANDHSDYELVTASVLVPKDRRSFY